MSARAGHQELGEVVLQVKDLRQLYGRGKRAFHAVDGVSFTVFRGETLGLVGESGCGKSTTARAVLGIRPPTAGSVVLSGAELTTLRGRALREARSSMQLVFQDPYNSVNPRWTVRQVVAEPLRLARWTSSKARTRVDELLDLVGLDPARFGDRSARQLSGGQAQRVGIARALTTGPELLVCDEAVSALDVSVQAQILNLLDHLKRELSLTTLFISHDLGVVRHVSDRVAVMYKGRIVETGESDQIFQNPQHHYTSLLLHSVLEVGVEPGSATRRPIEVQASQGDPAAGCLFAPRCPGAGDICRTTEPELTPISLSHAAACHFPTGVAGPTRRSTSQ